MAVWFSLPSVGRAQTADELAFWKAVQADDTAAEYQAYLDAYPSGRFVPLARLRLSRLSHSTERPSAPAPPPQETGAWVRPVRTTLRFVDSVTLDMDAQSLRSGSNLRLALVPADEPDMPVDREKFLQDSVAVTASRLRLSIPGGLAGRTELRLYYIARFADSFSVAARAPLMVAEGVPGAVLSRTLVREAIQLGPVRFEVNHRNKGLLVQAAFLGVRPQTEWNVQWFGAGGLREVPRQILVVSIGQAGVAADALGSRGEAICLLDAGDTRILDRVSTMAIGDPILVAGVPTSWTNAGPADPVLLAGCALRN